MMEYTLVVLIGGSLIVWYLWKYSKRQEEFKKFSEWDDEYRHELGPFFSKEIYSIENSISYHQLGFTPTHAADYTIKKFYPQEGDR